MTATTTTKTDLDLITKIGKWGTVGAIAFFGVFFVVLAVLARYTDYMRRRPWRFTAELMLLSLGGAIPIIFIGAVRSVATKTYLVEFAVLFAKIAVLYLLMELSGINRMLFGPLRV